MRIFIIIQKQYKTPLFTWKETKSSRRSHKAVRGKRKELGSSHHTCQGYDTQMLLMHGLSYGPALTRNTKERASVCQSDQVGPQATSCNLPFNPDPNHLQLRMSFIPNCRAEYHSSLDLLTARRPAPFYLLGRAGL